MWLVLGLTQGMKGFLSFLSAPIIGALSDAFGRKNFLLLTVVSTCLPLPFLLIHNLWFHVIILAISGAFAVTFSIVFAYVSDITSEQDRSAAFGQVSATFAASLVVSPALGSALNELYGPEAVYILSTLIALLDILFIIFFVPESMAKPSRANMKQKLAWMEINPFKSLSSIFSSFIMLKLSFIVFFSYLPEAGEYQCLMLYLDNTLHFSETQLAAFIATLGILSILAQTTVLSALSARFTQRTVILVGLAFSVIQLFFFGVVTAKWLIFVVSIVAALGSMGYPSISAMVSHTATAEQQGAVQGMVTGIRSLCTGLGPALFGVLFQAIDVSIDDDGSKNPRSFLPGTPFIVGSALAFLALLAAFSLPERMHHLVPVSETFEMNTFETKIDIQETVLDEDGTKRV
eukprot:m.89489 g.89489  ORF g.89489 m.89489 type:complete len:404 (+) comp51040_c0_seq5:336-1547(+)